MKKVVLFILTILASCATNRYAVRFEPPVVPRITAEIVSVTDGDTVLVRITGDFPGIPPGERSVRMVFMDAPESSANVKLERNLLQYFSRGSYVRKDEIVLLGKKAAERLKNLLRTGFQIELEFPSRDPTDLYGRLLAQVYLNGTNINHLLVREGMADAYFLNENRCPANDYYRKRFLEARDAAKRERAGIWKTLK